MSKIINGMKLIYIYIYISYYEAVIIACLSSILTWILGVASRQLRLFHGRVGVSTTLVNSLSPQMSELVEDAVPDAVT